jgi:choline-glycine betaine transporter
MVIIIIIIITVAILVILTRCLQIKNIRIKLIKNWQQHIYGWWYVLNVAIIIIFIAKLNAYK